MGSDTHSRGSHWDWIRNRIAAGLIMIVPGAFTFWVVWQLVLLLDRSLGDLVRPPVETWLELLGWPRHLAGPLTIGLSFMVALLTILAAGILSRFLIVRRAIKIGEEFVDRIPLVRFFYMTPREVLRTLSASKKTIKRVVMIEYPRRGLWCVAYATGEMVHQPDGRSTVSVFLPTTPNPTSGFLLMVPAEDVYDINMTTEDAVRFIISGGILSPRNVHMAPFAGLNRKPVLPPPEPLTTDATLAFGEPDANGKTPQPKSE